MVFTPDGLDKTNQEGRFIWAGWGNWTLIRPDRYLEQAWHKMLKAQADYRDARDLVDRLKKELEDGGKGEYEKATADSGAD